MFILNCQGVLWCGGVQANRGDAQECVSLQRRKLEARQPTLSVYFLAEDSFNSVNADLGTGEKIYGYLLSRVWCTLCNTLTFSFILQRM